MSKQTLSLDLRERVVSAVAAGMSRRQAAERFGVSAASAVRWCAREKETGSPAARPRGGAVGRRACERTGPAGYLEAARGMVRKPAGLDPERLVFIDETWATTNMARKKGRAPKGERLRAAAASAENVGVIEAALRSARAVLMDAIGEFKALPPQEDGGAQ
ncbi:MAG: hypothetical protein FD172_4075 [Methylocystaceae bacterium]|nr:MAG: hypothetical protein FD172_4075 [Methylocystaceae bacterium]